MENVENVAKEERLAAQRAYMKIWRTQNKDKLKGYRERYWAKVAAAAKEGD